MNGMIRTIRAWLTWDAHDRGRNPATAVRDADAEAFDRRLYDLIGRGTDTPPGDLTERTLRALSGDAPRASAPADDVLRPTQLWRAPLRLAAALAIVAGVAMLLLADRSSGPSATESVALVEAGPAEPSLDQPGVEAAEVVAPAPAEPSRLARLQDYKDPMKNEFRRMRFDLTRAVAMLRDSMPRRPRLQRTTPESVN